MSQPLVLRLLAACVSVSNKAGKIIRDILSKGDLGIVEKEGKHDLQTEADRSAQRCIMASLQKLFPNISIFGEEELDGTAVNEEDIETHLSEEVLQYAAKFPADLANVSDSEITVWVDPVDGTAEYTEGLLDHVTVLIGIAVRAKAVAGVIYQPYYNYKAGPGATLGRTIWGVIGMGAYGFELKRAPEGQNIITTTRSHGTGAVADAVTACEPTETLKVGGAGHKVLLLLDGKAHAYVFGSPGCKKWDTCAPEAVLHAAGGRLTDIHGNLYSYHSTVQRKNSGGVLATSRAEIHQWYVDRIPASVKAALPTVV